jgi:hypothetical protein
LADLGGKKIPTMRAMNGILACGNSDLPVLVSGPIG